MQNYNNLRVTARARSVVKEAYLATDSFPKREMFGLVAQMRRAAISSALNIVEGCSRRSTKELIRFLEISVGSSMELEFCCVLADDLGFGNKTATARLISLNKTFQRELSALIAALRKRKTTGTRE